ncbi:MAG: hypothetical protein PHS42_08180, partial [Sulfurimonas sp.]|nr:hypothetical protein [Sulfurimonas sp.]
MDCRWEKKAKSKRRKYGGEMGGGVGMLTTGSDSFVGTAKNDLFTSANGTLAANDTILDSSTTDHDIL